MAAASGPARPRPGRRHLRISLSPQTGIAEHDGEAAPKVFIVDDDPSLREALSSLFRSVGMRVAALRVDSGVPAREAGRRESCLVLDVRLPGVSGLDFQTQLAKAGNNVPIVFMTGHGDMPMSVRAMKAGAVDFLTKPFRDQDMLDAVRRAGDRSRRGARAKRERASAQGALRDADPARARGHGLW